MGFFKKILGGSKQKGQETQMESILSAANKVVNDYGDFMQSPVFPAPGCIADTKKLPYDKQIIKTALIVTLKLCGDSQMKEMLKIAYIGLADFQEGVGETDVGLDMRKLPDRFNDRTELESVVKQMAPIMRSYEKFKEIVEEERLLLQKDLAQI